ncbi:phosphoenolpyruvate carboxykinase (ATP) [Chloracidobacterium thermophilum]|uniref:Serine kinase of the HPr protein, regulates carbohydrate metabolism n=1 Tax=Chloracidobacterium thermophilum (strain B) TaxID=981222 RepID=G2LH34_CHLTF|nr:hypothetical protein [Chloracidobacterium thermophilum]AEP11776.1 hypothetical protein Cabther_A1022 [Chloracidobacterium thermophilum B]QUV79642.1 hypothetical protein J8C08_05165 [Chloracidobacterium thermophilum]
MALAQVVYGRRLTTTRPVPFLQPVHLGEDTADGFLAFEENPTPPRPPACAPWYQGQIVDARQGPELVAYHEPETGLFHFCYNVGTAFTYDHPQRRITALWSPPQTFEDTCTYLTGPILGFVLQIQQRVCLHASTVAIGASAVAFVGPNGTGKSTLAAALLRRGAEIIAEDVAAVEQQTDGFVVHLGPRAIRLWDPSVTALYGRPDALPCISKHWEKRYLPLDTHEQHRPAQLTDVYLLEVVPAEAPVSSTQLPPMQAVMQLLPNIYPDWLPLPEARVAILDTLTQLVTAVRVSRLSIPHSFSRLDEVCDYVLARHS